MLSCDRKKNVCVIELALKLLSLLKATFPAHSLLKVFFSSLHLSLHLTLNLFLLWISSCLEHPSCNVISVVVTGKFKAEKKKERKNERKKKKREGVRRHNDIFKNIPIHFINCEKKC